MLDESLLDTPDALARADTRGLLRAAAESGARVRTALREAREAGVAELRPDGRPRSVLVAGHGVAISCVAELLNAFGNGALQVNLLRPTGALAAPGALRWSLPGWVGSLDLLLVTTDNGDEPGLGALVDQAYQRGCTVVAITPPRSELAEIVGHSRGMTVPLAPGPYDAATGGSAATAGAAAPGESEEAAPAAPEQQTTSLLPGTLWALLTPVLALADRLNLIEAPWPALEALADRLDEVARRCAPAVETYGNPAKTLATELSETLPLVWSEGAIAGAAARHCATLLAALPGRPALAAELPEAMSAHAALLAGAFQAGGDTDDFFRDRVEEGTPLHARVILLRERSPGSDSAVVGARDLAHERSTPLSELEPEDADGPLQAAAELVGILDFAAVYLTLTDSDTP